MNAQRALRFSRRWGLALGLVATLIGAACKRQPPPPPPPPATPEAPESALPRPDGIVGEGILRAPDTILASTRSLLPIVPDKVGPLVAQLMAVPAPTAESIDGAKPTYFVLEQRGDSMGFVVAFPIAAGQKPADALERGPYERSVDAPTAITVFESKVPPKRQVLGLRRGFLLAASSREALLALGPYVTRTLPQLPLPTDDVLVTVPQAAVRGAVHDWLKSLIDEGNKRRAAALAASRTSGGAGPKGVPLGWMAAASDLAARQNERTLAWLADAGDTHVALKTEGGAIRVHADITVAAPDSALAKSLATWSIGEARGVLDVPAGAILSFYGRSSETDRKLTSTDLSSMLTTFYPSDIGAKEKADLGGFLDAWDAARGDETTGAILYEGPAKIGVGLRLSAKDGAVLAKSLRRGIDAIVTQPGVVSGLQKDGIGAPKFSNEKLAGIDVTVMTMKLPQKPGETPKPGEPETAEVIWGPSASGKELLLTAGVGARSLMATWIDGHDARALGADRELGKHVEALGKENATTVVVMPSRIVPLSQGSNVTSASPPADAVIASFGKSAKGPWLDLSLSRPAVEILGKLASRWLGGGSARPPAPSPRPTASTR